ncbi:MAG: DUF4038 domain-containing protein [Thermoanaerobaculia bacterium]
MESEGSVSRAKLPFSRCTLLIAIVVSCTFPRTTAAQSSAVQWRQWEYTLTSTTDYTQNGGNPYRDLVISVTYTNQGTGAVFKGIGFWTGGKTFKIRSAFPAGNWKWSTTCIGSTGASNCAGDTGLTRGGTAAETITVSGLIIGDDRYRLYNKGFLKVSADGRYLTYGSGEPFFWLADTAWTAAAEASAADWSSYMEDRYQKGFTSVLVVPAPDYATPTPPDVFNELCASSDPEPNSCSYLKTSYWDQFDNKVRDANEHGIVVGVAGLMDPTDTAFTPPGTGEFPRFEDAVAFARNLAARLAGRFVIFSPAWDTRTTVTVKRRDGTSTTGLEVMRAIGNALIQAAASGAAPAVPRHLVGNHLGGGSPYSDYQAFHGEAWLKLQLFQSGHAESSGACPGLTDPNPSDSIPVQTYCVTKRAREMPLTFRGYAPAKPNGNAEAVYDPYPSSGAEPETSQRVRQTGHLSTLSGAFGFTLGVQGIIDWSAIPGAFQSTSSGEMIRLRNLFQPRPWKDLIPRPERITNQHTEEIKKMVLAVAANESFALAYMPDNPWIDINTGSLPSFNCLNYWTKTWWNPRANGSEPAQQTCGSPAGVYRFNRPTSGGPDWALMLEYTGSGTCVPIVCGSDVGLPQAEGVVHLWPATDETGKWRISSRHLAASADKSSTLVSELKEGVQKGPRLARSADGYVAVWEEEHSDGSLFGIFGRRLDVKGIPTGATFQVNSFTEADQIEPAIAGLPEGTQLVVWTSLGQDGDGGGIFGQFYDRWGSKLGDELQVNSSPAGDQSSPRVAADAAGLFVVAWEAGSGGERRIFARLFDRGGNPLDEDFRVDTIEGYEHYLVDLAFEKGGNLSVEWASYTLGSDAAVRYRRYFDRFGSPEGIEQEIDPTRGPKP